MKKLKVTWVMWLGGQDWICERCSRRGTMPSGCSMTTFVRFLRDVMRERAGCPEPPAPKEAA